MSFALGATSSLWDVLQSLRAQSGTTSQTTASAFEPTGDVAPPASTSTPCSSCSCSSPLSSQTLGALIAAHSSSVVDPSNSPPGASGTDPQGSIAATSPTTVTNADGSTTTSFTWSDGTKVTVTAPAPSSQAPSVAWPSNLASLSYNQIAQLRPIEAQSLSTFAPAHLPVSA
jgi:hypothetical protein